MVRQSPALLPHDMDQGGTFHDADASVQQDVIVRRIQVKTPDAVFARRPSVSCPPCVDAPLRAKQPAPGDRGGDRLLPWPLSLAAMRCAGLAPGWRLAPSLVGTTVKDSHQGPRELGADAPLPQVAKQQVSVPPTVGGGGFLGVSVVEAAETVTLERGDGACAKDAKALAPTYPARAVAPRGGKRRARQGVSGVPRARWGGGFSTRS